MRRVRLLEENAGGPRSTALGLPEDVAPLAGVRRWTGEMLSDLSDDEVGDCLLMVTELVANAYDHGEPPRRLRLDRFSDPCRVRIEVDDASSGDVVVGRSRLGDHRGRGMLLVVNLSANWGVHRHGSGKTVWAEVPCSAPPPASRG